MPIPNYKDIIDLLKKGLTVEAQEKIMELRGAALELEEENVSLKRENTDLKAKLELRGKVNHKPPFFNLEGEDKPLCPKCWQSESKPVYLIRSPFGRRTNFSCPVCKYSHVPDGNVTACGGTY
jgi:hypothetical protein